MKVIDIASSSINVKIFMSPHKCLPFPEQGPCLIFLLPPSPSRPSASEGEAEAAELVTGSWEKLGEASALRPSSLHQA
jgi:hypothetical protein